MVFHVLNRGVGRRALFTKDEDFLAFERVADETLRTWPMRICAYCLMSNHWHFILRPERDGELAAFMQQMTNMHVKRWKEHRREIGYGHLYQGRYKCFPIESDGYFYHAVRYVERNALRAGMVERAENWLWSSLRRGERDEADFPLVSPWPLARPADWLRIVNEPQGEAELEVLRRSVNRGCPYGNSAWVANAARTLGLRSTLQPRGRPRKERHNESY
jgi:putative transposase